MKLNKKLKYHTASALLIVFLGLSNIVQANIQKVDSDSLNQQDLNKIVNHLVKNEFKSKTLKSITINTSTMVYILDRGLTDSSAFKISELPLKDARIIFSDSIPDTAFSVEIVRINYFKKSNKYEIKVEQRTSSIGGYSSSYVYKQRKGLFKRWVYKRYVGRIWCGYF